MAAWSVVVSAPVDVLAAKPRDGEHYVTDWYRGWGEQPAGTYAVMRASYGGLGGMAFGGQLIGPQPSKEAAEAECARLNAALARVQGGVA
jgi:hypothetical protein